MPFIIYAYPFDVNVLWLATYVASRSLWPRSFLQTVSRFLLQKTFSLRRSYTTAQRSTAAARKTSRTGPFNNAKFREHDVTIRLSGSKIPSSFARNLLVPRKSPPVEQNQVRSHRRTRRAHRGGAVGPWEQLPLPLWQPEPCGATSRCEVRKTPCGTKGVSRDQRLRGTPNEQWHPTQYIHHRTGR